MQKVLSIILFLPILSACSSSEHAEPEVENFTNIQGILHQGKNKVLYLEKIGQESHVLMDTIFIGPHDEFQTRFIVDRPGFFAIRNETGQTIIFSAYGSKDTIYIDGIYNDFNEYDLSGSNELKQISLLHRKTNEFLTRMDEFARITNDSIDSPNYSEIRLKINREYQAAFSKFRKFSEEFIQRNQGSLVTLLALSNQLGPNFYAFHPEKDIQLFQQVDSILMQKWPESDAVKALHNQILLIKNQPQKHKEKTASPEIGDVAPEIELASPEGQPIPLSSTKGKVVLLNFWASWSMPCRRQNASLVKIYEKFSKHGFEIYQVSLDRSEEKWIEAIEEDDLAWVHVSDLRKWNSRAVSLYDINSIPANYLLDQQGRIIARNLKGPELENKLAQIFVK